jgi:hypothetical protein
MATLTHAFSAVNFDISRKDAKQQLCYTFANSASLRFCERILEFGLQSEEHIIVVRSYE